MSESTSTRYHFNDTARRTTLATDVAQGDGTIEVNTATNLPSTPFLVAVWTEQSGGNFKYHEGDMEMMEVTAVSGTTLTVTRGVAGTSAMLLKAGDLVETSVQTARVMDTKLPTVSAAEYTDDTANGGEAIQAAIDALPSRGGTIHIPVEGPDDGLETGRNQTANGVWQATSPIVIDKPHVTLVGTLGVENTHQEGGSVIMTQKDDTLSEIIRFEEGAGCGLQNLRISGGGAAVGSGGCTDNIVVSNENADLNHFTVFNCEIHEADRHGINFSETSGTTVGGSSFHIDNCRIGDQGGSCIAWTQGSPLYTYITSTTFFNSRLFVDIQTDMTNLYMSNINAGTGPSTHETAIRVAANVQLWLTDMTEFGASSEGIKVESGATLTGSIKGFQMNGGGDAANFINNQGVIEDLNLKDIEYFNLTGSPYVNVVNDTTNTTRVTLDGLGYNGSNNPFLGGDWNGNGREGVRVMWTTSDGTEMVSQYTDGRWEFLTSLALTTVINGIGYAGGELSGTTVLEQTPGLSLNRNTSEDRLEISSTDVNFTESNTFVDVTSDETNGFGRAYGVEFSNGEIHVYPKISWDSGSVGIDSGVWRAMIKIEYYVVTS